MTGEKEIHPAYGWKAVPPMPPAGKWQAGATF